MGPYHPIRISRLQSEALLHDESGKEDNGLLPNRAEFPKLELWKQQ